MKYQISWVRAFKDNYIWIIHNDKFAVVVDPGDSQPVVDFLTTNNLDLVVILLTHEHADHVGGVDELVARFPSVKMFGCGSQDYQDFELFEIPALDLTCQVINTPGHTNNHVIFLIDNKHLFCGDVLFSLGCGRVFTGDFYSALQSLNKIKNLPTDTLIYPAHEYTLANLKFTLMVDNNYQYYDKLILTGSSLPTKLSEELKYNLFLRVNDRYVHQMIENAATDEVFEDELSYFIALRELRNNF